MEWRPLTAEEEADSLVFYYSWKMSDSWGNVPHRRVYLKCIQVCTNTPGKAYLLPFFHRMLASLN